MGAKDDQREMERYACEASAKIAFYVPVEYGACYGPNCFQSTIVDFSENGFGIVMGEKLNEHTVVNIFPNRACPPEENSPVEKVYQSKIKWVKKEKKTGPALFRIGVQHIR